MKFRTFHFLVPLAGYTWQKERGWYVWYVALHQWRELPLKKTYARLHAEYKGELGAV